MTEADVRNIVRQATNRLNERVAELERRVAEVEQVNAELRQVKNELHRGVTGGSGLAALEELWRT